MVAAAETGYTQAHTAGGTHFGAEAAAGYFVRRHGRDGELFLDKFFLPHITGLNGEIVGDIGAGVAPWAIHAAQQGAGRVLALDYDPAMLTQAQTALEGESEEVRRRITLLHGNATALPLFSDTLDIALSINVACNLPQESFAPHFREMYRVLKSGQEAVVTAIANFGIIFTSGAISQERIRTNIDQALEVIGSDQSPETIRQHLNTLTHIYGATFAFRDDKLVLIDDETLLKPGEAVWRKIPAGTIPNFYHSENEYLKAAEEAGFEIIAEHRASFSTEDERITHNKEVNDPKDTLGPTYVGNHRYTTFVLRKS